MNKVSNEEFIVAWMNSESIDEVADKTGLQYSMISAKACNLRRKGVLLPKYRRAAEIDIDQLNKIINDELAKQPQA